MFIQISSDFEIVAKIHQRIFVSPFPMDKLNKRLRRGDRLLTVLFQNAAGVIIGYSIAIEEKTTLHLWIGGLLPEVQGNGLMAEYIEWLENYALENSFEYLTMNMDNYKTHSLRFALKQGFSIMAVEDGPYGDGKKISLQKRVTRPLHLRLALTRQCNFNCIFCHGEGLPPCPGASLDSPKVESILVQASKLNIGSVTFTGGEPLLEKDALLHGLRLCRDMGKKIAVKLVTNGSLLDEQTVAQLAEFPDLHVNLSIHGGDAHSCALISGRKDAFDNTCRAMNLLREYGLSWRINCVPLRGIADNEMLMKRFMELLLLKGASEISFLELSAEAASPLAKHHMPLPQLLKIISTLAEKFGSLHFLQDRGYKSSYKLMTDSSALQINLFTLSCGNCRSCAGRKDECIGPDGMLYPCFFSSQPCGDAVADLYGALCGSRAFVQERISSAFDPGLVGQRR